MYIVTLIILLFIFLVFFLYFKHLWRLKNITSQLNSTNNPEELAKENSLLAKINSDYEQTKSIDTNGGKKSFHSAEEFYNDTEFARCYDINLKHINSAPGVLSGLGVLGTFIGLTVGVSGIDSANSNAIMSSINNLLAGTSTAFITSLFGMGLSAIFIWFQNNYYNKYNNAIAVFCKKLNLKNHISADEIIIAKNEQSKQEVLQKLEFIQNSLMIQDEEGVEISTGTMIYNLYEESEKQSQALESFTTDLSNELNASLGKTMDTSIVPLIQNLEKCHDTLNSNIETLSNNIKSPAADLVNTAVNELQKSMLTITNEFRDALSNQTENQMNTIATELTQVGEMINVLPQMVKEMSESVAHSFNNVATIVGDLQGAVAKQQEEMIEGSRAANDMLAEGFKQKFDDMTSYQQTILNKMSEHLETTVKSLATQLEKTAGTLNSQQATLIEAQASSTRELELLLQTFNQSISNMHNANSESAKMLSSIQKANDNLNCSTEKFKELSANLESTAKDVMKHQNDSAVKFEEIQQQNQDVVSKLTEAITIAQKMVDGYAQDFETIRTGIKDIFKGINEGLKDYSKTIRESTGDALAEYSDAIEKSTKGLMNIAQGLADSVEELTDGIDKIKMMK